MISAPKLPDITSKADLAFFGLGYAVGFALYAFVLRLNTPPPTTVALVAAFASLGIKSGMQALQEREPPTISEQERQENLRNRFIAFEELFSEGTQLYKTDYIKVLLNETIELESRVVPNPYYIPPHTTTEGGEEVSHGGEPQYREQEVTEAIYEKILVLHALWQAGTVTDAYAEARLDELTDFCSRNALTKGKYLRPVEVVEDSHFGPQLARFMYNKGVSRAELAKRTGISMDKIRDFESTEASPNWSTALTLAAGLEMDLADFAPRRSDEQSSQR